MMRRLGFVGNFGKKNHSARCAGRVIFIRGVILEELIQQTILFEFLSQGTAA